MLPTLAELRAWLNLPATALDDEALQGVLDAEAALQARRCRIPAEGIGADLKQALYRRVGREVAAKGLPLGLAGVESELGPTRLSRFDAEIERLEGPSRMVVFG